MTASSGLYVLDTRLVAHVARGDQIGTAADKRFGLRTRLERPLDMRNYGCGGSPDRCYGWPRLEFRSSCATRCAVG